MTKKGAEDRVWCLLCAFFSNREQKQTKNGLGMRYKENSQHSTMMLTSGSVKIVCG